MRRAVACFFVAVSCAPAARAATPLEIYGRLPDLESVALSPNGKLLAFARTSGDKRFVAVVSLDTRKPVAVVGAGDAKLRTIEWADDKHVLIGTSLTRDVAEISGGKDEWSQLSVFDVDAKTLVALPRKAEEQTMNVISGSPMVRNIDGRTVLFVPGVWIADYVLPALFRYDLESGEQKLVERGGKRTRQWFVDAGGNVAARVTYDEGARRWGVAALVDGQLRLVSQAHAEISIPTILGFGPDDGSMLIASPNDDEASGKWELAAIRDGADVAIPPTLAEDVEEPLYDPVTHHLIGGSYTADSTSYAFVDPGYRARWQSVVEAFPESRAQLVSASRDFERVVARLDRPKVGPEYVLMDLKASRAEPLGKVYEGIAERHETRAMRYPAQDGLEIPGYLTLPAGKRPAGLPLVVLVHGGPAARDTADFDWWSQALASQGYAVLQPNFRGSLLGAKFVQAGFGEWGRKMQTDVSDGVRYLAKEGTVDPRRVCIVGASYGGYAALAGVTLEPGVYRCAVSVAGVSDIEGWLRWESDNSSERAQRFWDRFLGVEGPKDPLTKTISPVEHVDAVTVPVLLVHGKDDTVVPYEQSEAMLRALRRAKRDVELVTLKHEDHWLSRSETRLQMLQASVAFLRRVNPPE